MQTKRTVTSTNVSFQTDGPSHKTKFVDCLCWSLGQTWLGSEVDPGKVALDSCSVFSVLSMCVILRVKGVSAKVNAYPKSISLSACPQYIGYNCLGYYLPPTLEIMKTYALWHPYREPSQYKSDDWRCKTPENTVRFKV